MALKPKISAIKKKLNTKLQEQTKMSICHVPDNSKGEIKVQKL